MFDLHIIQTHIFFQIGIPDDVKIRQSATDPQDYPLSVSVSSSRAGHLRLRNNQCLYRWYTSRPKKIAILTKTISMWTRAALAIVLASSSLLSDDCYTGPKPKQQTGQHTTHPHVSAYLNYRVHRRRRVRTGAVIATLTQTHHHTGRTDGRTN